VVLTSFADGGTFSVGTIVRIPRIVTVYGISNKSAFKNTGKFVCEFAGFYLFSVHILTNSNDAAYQMLKNDKALSHVYVIYSDDHDYYEQHSGTGVIATQLNVGDTLYVKAYKDNMYIHGGWSSMTVIKIR